MMTNKNDSKIYSAVQSNESVQYVPLLAKQGVKHKVGGNNARGGLLLGDGNVLELLTYAGDSSETDVLLYLDAMKKLRESKLLLKEDIRDYEPFVPCMRP